MKAVAPFCVVRPAGRTHLDSGNMGRLQDFFDVKVQPPSAGCDRARRFAPEAPSGGKEAIGRAVQDVFSGVEGFSPDDRPSKPQTRRFDSFSDGLPHRFPVFSYKGRAAVPDVREKNAASGAFFGLLRLCGQIACGDQMRHPHAGALRLNLCCACLFPIVFRHNPFRP